MDDDFQISEEVKSKLRERQSELVRIVDALSKLEGSKEWLTLKELVFDKSLQSIERQIQSESLRLVINPNVLYRLQGERTSVKRFTDISVLGENLRKQLEDIKLKLK